jgi:hypothetical protein
MSLSHTKPNTRATSKVGMSQPARIAFAIIYYLPVFVYYAASNDTLVHLAQAFGTSTFALQMYALEWQFLGIFFAIAINSHSSDSPSANIKAQFAKAADCIRVQLIAMFSIFGLWVVAISLYVGIAGLTLRPLAFVILCGVGALAAILISLPVAFRYQWKTYPEDFKKWPFGRADKACQAQDKTA